jgi:hypothetical protein
MNSHYAIRATVQYYGYEIKNLHRQDMTIVGAVDRHRPLNTARWTVSPHVQLANLPTFEVLTNKPNMAVKADTRIDPAAAESFVKRYGPVYGADTMQLEPTYEKKSILDGARSTGAGPKAIKLKQLKPGGEFTETIPALTSAQYSLRLAWNANVDAISDLANELGGFTVEGFEILRGFPGEVVLETDKLWSYIAYLFLVDHAEKRTGVCERKDCPTPYFIRQRRGQRYCSHECAVLENVRRFRDVEKKRRSK